MITESLSAAEIIPNRITLDYLYHYKRISHFYSCHFTERKFREVRVDRAQVVKILREYNRKIDAPQKVMENIEMLLDDNTYAVITGQQPGIFTGPLYTIYKALSAIIVANNLSDKKHPLVPIFWNASEDHDLSEIDHIYLMKENEPLRINYPVSISKSASEVRVDTKKIEKMISRINEVTPDTEFKNSLLKNLQSLAQRSESLGEIFSRIMIFLLGEYGLILIEPKYLRKMMIPLFKKMIDNPTRCSRILNKAGDRLKKLGHHPPIHKNSNLCNFFLERKNVTYDKGFHVANNTYSSNELLDLLEKNPLSFSANVVTRPITQDYLFPTYAYIAGPSEIAYFSQLKEIYKEFMIEMPLIYPRFGATIIENKVLSVLKKYNLEILDLRFPQSLTKRLAKIETASLFNSGRKEILKIFSEIEKVTTEIDFSLKNASQSSLRRVLREISCLEDKVVRNRKRQNIVVENQINKVAYNIFPEGKLQERKINVLEYLIKFGQDFLKIVHDEFSGTDYGEHRVITFRF
ncbi:bacillithiol biosynthesis cysteine-adding enzyme BshC [Patescibacteria group bacterium]|nr:bacillithiol biosynthesis cysteine-adding enzyme BshC [Patescibacteria group bacterium]